MSETNQKVNIRAIRRDEPDLRRLARALIDLAIEQSQQAKEADDAGVEEQEAA